MLGFDFKALCTVGGHYYINSEIRFLADICLVGGMVFIFRLGITKSNNEHRGHIRIRERGRPPARKSIQVYMYMYIIYIHICPL